MHIIILSGGSGTRLWPLSNEVRSKQFIKVFTDENGNRESMLQRMFRMIREEDPGATVTVATGESQIPSIAEQLESGVLISKEPCRRDTFPAIALAAAKLAASGVSEEEPVVVCPVDPYVNRDYFAGLKRLSDEAAAGRFNLTLMGIRPTEPSTKYGYIIPVSQDPVSPVKEFREKPDKETAAAYIRRGALWNGGIFAFRLGYLMRITREICGTDCYEKLYRGYAELKKISFDYAVAEKEENIGVIRFDGQWKDIGTWNSLTETIPEKVTGNCIADRCENTHAINELEIPMIVLGMKNAVVAATPDGILVSDKETSASLKDYVVSRRPMYERRVWGEYRVLKYDTSDPGRQIMVKELVLDPGKHISYQVHSHRTEMWTFTKGSGELVIDGRITKVTAGDTISIHSGVKHGLKASEELHVIEVQMGDDLIEEDITRLDWNWD